MGEWHHSMNRVALLALFVLLWAGTGCEEGVDPVLETSETYSLYGFFDPSADRQAVRVYSIDGVLENSTVGPMDAVVRSINRSTGEEVTWSDSVITFPDRSVGHVYHAPFRAEFDTPYTLRATRSDGRTTEVDVRTPPDGDTLIEQVSSTRSQVIVELTWSNVPRIIKTEVSYFVRVPFPDGSDTTTVRVDIDSGRTQENSNGTWSVFILPSADIGVVFSALQVQPGVTPVFLDKIEARAFVTSDDWESPVGVFDPELLVQPGTFSNVTGGFGFVGGGYFDRFEFVLDDRVARDAGFAVE